MTTTWNRVGMPSLRSSTYGCDARLAKQRHPSGQTGRLLQIDMGHGVTISCMAIPHPVSFNRSDGGSELTVYQDEELRWGKYRICAINPDYDGEGEEEDQNAEDDMDDEDCETTSLEYHTANDRAGGRLGAKYERQETRDVMSVSAASRTGDQNPGRTRATAMNQRRATGEAKIGDRVQYHDWASIMGERRRQVNPPGRVSAFHNHRFISQLGRFQIPYPP